MSTAEQRNNSRKTGIIQRLSNPEPNKLRKMNPTKRSGGGLSIQRRAQPPRSKRAGGSPKLLSKMMLLKRIGRSRNLPLKSSRRSSNGGLRLPVQGSGLIDTPRRLHRLTSVCALKPYLDPEEPSRCVAGAGCPFGLGSGGEGESLKGWRLDGVARGLAARPSRRGVWRQGRVA